MLGCIYSIGQTTLNLRKNENQTEKIKIKTSITSIIACLYIRGRFINLLNIFKLRYNKNIRNTRNEKQKKDYVIIINEIY